MANRNININISVRTAGINKQLQSVNSQLSRVSQNATRAEKSTRRLGKGMGITATQLSALTGGFFALQGAFRVISSGVSAMIQFEKTMSAVQAVSGATSVQFQRMSDLARQLGATTAFSASQAAEGLKFLSMAGFSTAESMASLETTLRLAQAGTIDLGRSADIMSNIMRAMNIEAEESGRVGDVLSTAMAGSNTSIEQLGDAFKYAGGIAGSLGLSLEETTAALSTLSNAGLQASMAGTGLRQVLVKLANPSNAMKEVLAGVGISVDQLDLSAGNLGNTLSMLANAGMSTGDIFKAFEARAGTAFTILASGVDDFKKLETANNDAKGGLEEMAGIMEDNLATQIMLLKSAFEELFISQNSLHSGMSEVVQTLTAFISVMNGTATSTDKTGKSQMKFIEQAMILKRALQLVAVAFIAIKLFKFASGIRASMVGMTQLGASTTATNVALRTTASTGGVASASIGSLSLSARASSIGMGMLTGATHMARGAMIALRTAIASTGIGLIVVAIGYAIGKILEFVGESDAMAESAKGDTNEIANSVKNLQASYGNLADEVKDSGDRGAKAIQRLIGSTNEGKEAIKEMKKAVPDEIIPIDQVKTHEDVNESLRAMKQAYYDLIKAKGYLDEDDEEFAINEQAQKALQDQIKMMTKYGRKVVDIRNAEEARSKIMEQVSENLKTQVKLIEQFNTKLAESDNARFKAEIDVQDAESKLKQSMKMFSADVGEMMGDHSGSAMMKSLRNHIAKGGDMDGNVNMEDIKTQLRLEFNDSGAINNMEQALDTLADKTFTKTKAEMIDLLGGIDKVTPSVMKAVNQFAILDSIKFTDLGTGSVFDQLTGETGGDSEFLSMVSKLENLKGKLEELRRLRNLETTIDFNNKAKDELSKLDKKIAETTLKAQGLQNALDLGSRMSSGTQEEKINALATAMDSLGKGRGDELGSVTDRAFDTTELKNFHKTSDGLTRRSVASSLRAIDTLQKVQTRKAFTLGSSGDIERDSEFGGLNFDKEAGKFKSVGDALHMAIVRGSAGGMDAGKDLIQLAILAGLGDTEAQVRKTFKDASEGGTQELNKLFTTMESFAEGVKNRVSEVGKETEDIASLEQDLVNLANERAEALEKQLQIMEDQQRAMSQIARDMEISQMEADFKMGANNVQQADIDFAKQQKKMEQELGRFESQVRKILDKEIDAQVAIKRGELNQDADMTLLQKKQALIDYEAKLQAEADARRRGLIEKQEGIMNQDNFANMITKSIESFKQSVEKFQKERKERQDKAKDFFDGAEKDQEEGDKEGGEPAVSSLARIGGGGGVGAGGDPMNKMVDLNKAQVNLLEEIARDMFGAQDFNDLDEDDQGALIAGVKKLQDMVNKGQLTPAEARKAMENAARLRAQGQQDEELKKVANVKDLAGMGVDKIEEKAPEAMENRGFQNIIKNFENLSEKQQAMALNKLQEENAPQEVIDALKGKIGDNFKEDKVPADFKKDKIARAEMAQRANLITPDILKEAKSEDGMIDEAKLKDSFARAVSGLADGDFDAVAGKIARDIESITGVNVAPDLQVARMNARAKELGKTGEGLGFDEKAQDGLFDFKDPLTGEPLPPPLLPDELKKFPPIDLQGVELPPLEERVPLGNGGLPADPFEALPPLSEWFDDPNGLKMQEEPRGAEGDNARAEFLGHDETKDLQDPADRRVEPQFLPPMPEFQKMIQPEGFEDQGVEGLGELPSLADVRKHQEQNMGALDSQLEEQKTTNRLLQRLVNGQSGAIPNPSPNPISGQVQ